MGAWGKKVENAIDDRLKEEEEEDLWDYMSEGDGEDPDSIEAPLQFDERFPNAILIANVPTVDKAKFDKLLGVLGKLISKHGECEKHMPINEATGKTWGFVIASFGTPEAATKAQATLDGFNLDKAHTFKVVLMDQYDQITGRPDEFVAQRTLNSFSRADFREWLADTKCREQLLLRYQAETEIYWHDMLSGAPVLCYGGEREKRQKKIWCDWRVQWSPWGSYLATFHKQGIALWAGPEYTKKMRVAHDGVKYADFSPNEDHVLTWNGSAATENDEGAVRIFRVLTGECVRKCRVPPVVPGGGIFPHFLWSKDGKYLAEMTESSILVRDTENFELIRDEEGKKRSLKYDCLDTFQWSPKDNIVAAWTLEKGNNPARLVLVEIPSRKELVSRSRTQCEATMHWQSEGDYLCLMVTKLSKTGKKGITNLEIFRMRDKNIPVDIVEIKDTVVGFHWETKGNRFSVITTDDLGHHPKLSMYVLGKEKCEKVAEFDLPSNSFNKVFWAPAGQYFVVAATADHGSSGDLLFGGLTADNKLEILHKDEHFMLTQVEWDPSSRYVITAVAQPMDSSGFKFSMEAGFAIWTFQGRLLYRQQKEKLWQVSWRPHPEMLLSNNRQKDIRKNIKTYTKKYDALDDQSKENARQAFRKERDEKTSAFQEVLDRLEEYGKERTEENGWDEAAEDLPDPEWEENNDIVEEELDTTEELISG